MITLKKYRIKLMNMFRKLDLFLFISLALPLPVLAANGHYVPGAEGLGAPQVPPPGVYYRGYGVYYDIDGVVDRDGKAFSGGNSGTVMALANRFVWITEQKVLGADYGVEAIFPVQSASLDFDGLGLDTSDSGMGDIFLGPLVLGWHGERWDAVAAAGIWLDTADFDATDPASVGRGHRTGMLTLGGTWHLDAERRWSLSALSRYEIKSEQDDTGITPGDSWLVEWGLGHRLSNGLELGLVGYDAWQLEADGGAASDDKAERHALGLEVGHFWPEIGVGLNGAAYHEYDVRAGSSGVAPEGSLFRVTLTKAF